MLRKETDFVRLLHGKSKSLSLGGKMLKSLPESIGLLQSLLTIDARKNLLDDLPISFQLLKNLECLHLSNNKFESVPDVIAQLFNLQTLVIFSNPLSDITAICSPSLTELRILNLNNCQISELPPQIKFLKSLEVLSMTSNKLISLPDELCELVHLRELIADKNHLESLPFEIGRLWSLNRLFLPHNNIKELPESLSKMERLKVLDVACNQIRIFPTDIHTMALEELYCESNPLIKKNIVKSVQEEEILTLKEMSARFVMRAIKHRGSIVRKQISFYPGVKELLNQSARCEICLESFLNTWLECVRFVPTEELGVLKSTVSSLPQRVLLCSYACFNSQGHDIYGIAFP